MTPIQDIPDCSLVTVLHFLPAGAPGRSMCSNDCEVLLVARALCKIAQRLQTPRRVSMGLEFTLRDTEGVHGLPKNTISGEQSPAPAQAHARDSARANRMYQHKPSIPNQL